MELHNPIEHKPKKRLHKSKPVRTLVMSLAAAGIFLLGLGIGDGRIVLSTDQLYRKTVQKNAPNSLDYSSVDKVYATLRSEFDGQLDNQKLLDGIKSGLVSAAGDPYTEYMSPKEAQDFDGQLNGTFTGVGAELGKDAQNNLVVISPISGFPAEKAGLKAQDIITQIDGKTTDGLTISEAVGKIRGDKGTKVKLTIVRNKSQQLDIEITRDTITIPSVESKILDGNIGYLKISRFGDDTIQLATSAADDFKSKNVKGIILDVRGDPGGLLDAAVGVSSLWLPKGKTILQEKRDGTVVKTYNSTGATTLAGIKTIVLIDAGSASASEITAGALHDNGVATLMGVKSYGKGSVQQLERYSDGSLLKVTIARWYTPGGINIDKEGIKPDTEVKFSDDDAKAQKDPQLDAAKNAVK